MKKRTSQRRIRAGKRVGLLLASLTALASLSDAEVVVDASGNGDFLEISDALISVGGDNVIVVEPGTYGGFTVQGISVTIHGRDPDQVPIVRGRVVIRDLALGQCVALRNLTIEQTVAPLSTQGILVQDCAGSVFLEELGVSDFFGALQLDSVADATLVRSSFRGADLRALDDAPPAMGPGLISTQSNVHAYDCEFRGGLGPDAVCGPNDHIGFPGEPGARVQGGFLYASGCSFTGGEGGDGCTGSMGCRSAGAGGHALELAGLGEQTYDLDCSFTGGLAGIPAPTCSGGSDGQPIHDPASTHTSFLGTARSFSAQSTSVNSVLLNMEGVPGDLVFVFASIDHSPLFLWGIGCIIPAFVPSLVVAPFGTIGSSGQLEVPYTLPFSLECEQLFLQAVFYNTALAPTLGGPSLLVGLAG